MLTEYVDAALAKAHYDVIEDDEPYYGEVRELPGVYATGATLEDCRRNLKDVVEGWLILSIKRDLPVPRIDGLTIEAPQETAI